MKKYSLEFTVIKERSPFLLGKRASEQMNLITVNDDNVSSVPESKQQLTDDADIFNEAGASTSDESATPHNYQS